MSNSLPVAVRAIAQAVSRRLLTAAARVRSQVRSCGICGGQNGAGASFLRVLLFPLPILIPPTAPHSSTIIRLWYNRPNSGRTCQIDSVSPHPKKAVAIWTSGLVLLRVARKLQGGMIRLLADILNSKTHEKCLKP
jgi:hypothetical protein